MKLSLKAGNSLGFSTHIALAVIVVLSVSALGYWAVTRSNANSSLPYVTISNVGKGARPDINVYRTDKIKSTGSDVNYITNKNTSSSKKDVMWQFCGLPNKTYYGSDLYEDVLEVPGMGLEDKKTYTLKSPSVKGCTAFRSDYFKTTDLCDRYTDNAYAIAGSKMKYKVKLCSLNKTTVAPK